MILLILSSEDADAVRGPSAQGAALYPVPLLDGSFALPLSVLLDPAHAHHHARLVNLDRRDVAPDEFPPSEE